MNDSTNPVIAINASKNNLVMGETATLSFTLSQASTNFSAADVTTIGGTLSNFTGSGTSYSATFTPSANVSSAFVMVGNDVFSNVAGTLNKDGADANNAVSFSVGLLVNTDAPADTTAPSVMISNTKTSIFTGETDLITFTLSEASSNFTQSDVTVIGGTLSGWAQSATNPLVYTAIFTPNPNALSAALFIASESFTDAAGNFNQDGMELNNMASIAIQCKIDTTPPTIIVTADKATLAGGQTALITFTLSELATDFTASDVTVTGGTLSGFAQSATNPLVYTATFTAFDVTVLGGLEAPTGGAISGSVTVDSNKFTDASGNQNADGADANNTANFTISLDVTPPTIIVSADKVDLLAGQTATITFTLSEASSNFSLSDISVTGGTLSNFQGSGTGYTATFTPTAGASTASVKVDSNRFTDAAGNNNKDGTDINNAVSLKTNLPPVTPPRHSPRCRRHSPHHRHQRRQKFARCR